MRDIGLLAEPGNNSVFLSLLFSFLVSTSKKRTQKKFFDSLCAISLVAELLKLLLHHGKLPKTIPLNYMCTDQKRVFITNETERSTWPTHDCMLKMFRLRVKKISINTSFLENPNNFGSTQITIRATPLKNTQCNASGALKHETYKHTARGFLQWEDV